MKTATDTSDSEEEPTIEALLQAQEDTRLTQVDLLQEISHELLALARLRKEMGERILKVTDLRDVVLDTIEKEII